jgi:hypothetical protein
MKAGPGKSVMIIEGRSAQIIRAFAVDQKLDAFFLDNRIPGLLAVERHFVLQPGASALCDLDSQAFLRISGLSLEQDAKLSHSVIGHVYHQSYEIIASLGQVKPSAARSGGGAGPISLPILGDVFLRKRESKL